MARILNVVAMLAVVFLSACSTHDGKSATGDMDDNALKGTSWKLVSFQSMDDSEGLAIPESGRVYTLQFGADGQLAMQLDCNRGSASYESVSASPTTGSLTIGPVAATRALCPPEDIGELLAQQLSYVASYMLRDNHLFLSLQMDGGIIEFSPETL